MIYSFRAVVDENGTLAEQVEEIAMPMSQAPRIGSRIYRGGIEYQRIPDLPATKVDRFKPYEDRSCYRGWTSHKGKFSKDNFPVFETKQQCIDAAKRDDDSKATPAGKLVYDP